MSTGRATWKQTASSIAFEKKPNTKTVWGNCPCLHILNQLDKREHFKEFVFRVTWLGPEAISLQPVACHVCRADGGLDCARIA